MNPGIAPSHLQQLAAGLAALPFPSLRRTAIIGLIRFFAMRRRTIRHAGEAVYTMYFYLLRWMAKRPVRSLTEQYPQAQNPSITA